MNISNTQTDEKKALFAEQLGYATELLYSCERKSFPISVIDYWIVPAILLRQIRFFFDSHGRPIAYVTWAYLSDEVSILMERDGVNILHLSDWNEGLNLWFLDLVAPYGNVRQICSQIKTNLLAEGRIAKAIKRDEHDQMIRLRRLTGRVVTRQ